MSRGFYIALVNGTIAIWALIWRLRNEPSISRRAKILRWAAVAAGVALVAYANYSGSAAYLVAIGGPMAILFLFWPDIADLIIRFFSKRDQRRRSSRIVGVEFSRKRLSNLPRIAGEREGLDFSSDAEMQKIPDLVREFLEHVLFDEEPLFISDEANIGDVSLATPEELIKRCSEYYGASVSANDLKQPLWKLIRDLNERRR